MINFPNSPTEGQTFSTPEGLQYIYMSGVWRIIGPQSPAPSDGGEYVMVNGVWRLVRQSFNLTGLSTLDIAVPAWGPKMARFSSFACFSGLTTERITLSADGTTFLSGASDYSYGNVISYTGSNGAAVAGSGSASNINYGITGDNATIPHITDGLLRIYHPTGNASYQVHATAHASSALALHSTYFARYYCTAAGLPAGTPVKAVRWFTSAVLAASSGEMTVDWLQ